MPDFGFSEAEINDLVAFLAFVDTAGVYDSPDHKPTWLGTVAQATE